MASEVFTGVDDMISAANEKDGVAERLALEVVSSERSSVVEEVVIEGVEANNCDMRRTAARLCRDGC